MTVMTDTVDDDKGDGADAMLLPVEQEQEHDLLM